MPPTSAEIERRNRLFMEKHAPAALPDAGEVARRNEQFAAKRASKSPKFLPAKSTGPTALPVEMQDQPIGETIERYARIAAGNAVGPGGVPGVVSMGLMLMEWMAQGLNPVEYLMHQQFGETPLERIDLSGQVTKAAGAAQDFVQGDVLPQTTGEAFIGKFAQEASAAAPLARALRAVSSARVAAGRGGRFAQGIARESPLIYYGSEALGAGGAAVARLNTEELGWLTESAAAIGGDMAVRYGALGALRLIGGLGRRLQLHLFEEIPAQEARMEREIYDRVRKAGGFDEMLKNPREARWLHDAAERLQRAAGGRENALDAAYRLKQHEAALVEVGIDPSSVSLGALTENPGLRGAEAVAIAINPRLAVNLEAGRQPGSKAVRDFMVAEGPPLDVSDMDALRAALSSEAARRIRATDEALGALERQADEAFGFAGSDLTDAAGAAQKAGLEASAAYIDGLTQAYRAHLRHVVTPAYENLAEFNAANPYLRWGVGNSKKMVADIRDELGSFSADEFPQQYLTKIDDWASGGVEFKELDEARKTLGEAALRAESGPNANLTVSRRLWRLRGAVIDDINKHDILFAEDIFPRAKGSVDDGTIGLSAERSRAEMIELAETARESYVGFARQFKDPIITGGIVRDARRRVPVEHSDQLGLYLKPGKDYNLRLADLRARVERSPEAAKLAEDWLIADAYQASMRNIEPPAGGAKRPHLDRKALDRWQETHAQALEVFDGAKRTIRSGAAFLERARLLGATPQTRAAERSARALEGIVDDPEKFWRKMRSAGTDSARRQIRDVIKTVRASEDPAAMMGLRESFWNHMLVETFAKGEAEQGAAELTFSAIDKVLGSPQLREAVVALEGANSLRTLRLAAKTHKAVIESSSVPASVRATKLKTATEMGKELAVKASVFSVILGPIRRTAKISKALDDFMHEMDDRHVSALIQEAILNPALRADLLRLDPKPAVIKAIRHRMTLNYPTLFPRAKAAAEKRDTDEAAKAEAKRKRERAAELRDQSARLNRGITAPPAFSAPGGAGSNLGIFS